MSEASARLPIWFEPGERYAGGLDDLRPVGLTGWAVDIADLSRRLDISVVAGGRTIARATTRQPRPDIGDLLGGAVACGFAIDWAQFEAGEIEAVRARDPEAEIRVVATDLGRVVADCAACDGLYSLTIDDLGRRLSGAPARARLGRARVPLGGGEELANFLDASPLFDKKFYLLTAGVAGSHRVEGSLSSHYLLHGERMGARPNPLFDPRWYAHKRLPGSAGEGALRHYLETGERAGDKPGPLFDPLWYCQTYCVDAAAECALEHYLRRRRDPAFNPNPYFDARFYLAHNRDVENADLDPFTHWFTVGLFEGRSGSPRFDAEFVRRRYLGGKRDLNPFELFMDVGLELGWEPVASSRTSVHRMAAESAEAGALFERLDPPAALPADAPAIVAMYLPQYHAIPENDAWWGEGFTEWRNLMRALPRYVGHIQPRIPRDLGFYELAGAAPMRRQIERARQAGVSGFCFYYYNFNGRRLLERPVETFLADATLDFPFCILWANENWSRRWDGSDQDILIQQDYRPDDAPALVADLARHMRDPRYMCSPGGRPLFFVYRADVIPDSPRTLEHWRALFRDEQGLDPLFVMCQTFGAVDPRPFGFDGALEFPPHKLTRDLPLRNDAVEMLDAEFRGQIYDYQDVVEASLRARESGYPLIKTAFPNWDNSARRQTRAMCIAHSTPRAFETWMAALIRDAQANPAFGAPMVFVNAWNEWCEGAYLEPDTHFGSAYLNALRRAVGASARDLRRIVLVGHDAFPSGAQHLLLNLGRMMRRQFGLEVRFVLLGGGALADAYRDTAETFIVVQAAADPEPALRERLSALFCEGFRHAICNTVVTGSVAPLLAELNYDFCTLAHELPTLVRSGNHAAAYALACRHGRAIVYPNAFVETRLNAEFGAAQIASAIIPQGVYNLPGIPAGAREQVRDQLGLPPGARIALNVGYGDLRKGVDLFLSLAEALPDVFFVWLGDVHPDLVHWLELDIERRGLRNLRLLPFDRDVGRYFGAADVFVSTSREDPFPSVVLEALSVGLPVVAFEGSGGHADLLSEDPRLGVVAPYSDAARAAERIAQTLRAREGEPASEAEHRRRLVAERFDFARYGAKLLRLVEPSYRSVSVVVPNFNYAAYLPERLESIFAQQYPVVEILLLDDASGDDSLEVARAAAARAGRTLTIHARAANSGSPFRQWKAGVDEVRGEFVWIAEADDSSDPGFLGEAIARLRASPDALFWFCDSRAIDADGATVYRNYKGYYAEFGDRGLDRSGGFAAEDFLRRFLTVRNLVVNVSSVVWRAQALREVFARLGEEAFALRCAGDWRVYVEACRLGGQILYASDPLNLHRRHERSMTQALDKRRHLREVAVAQAAACEGLEADSPLREQAARWRERLAREWRVDSPEPSAELQETL